MSKVLREQHAEFHATFAGIRQKITQAQTEIRASNEKTRRLEEEKADRDDRYDVARRRCVELRNQIADKERDLFDIENQIPAAKAKMHELESISGENTHFKKSLERTRTELEDAEKKREKSNALAKEKSEDAWQAKQRLHKIEVELEEVEKHLDFSMRRIIVARDKLAAAESQSTVISENIAGLTTVQLEAKLNEMQHKLDVAKERRKIVEEKEMKQTWENEELEKQVQSYYEKMGEMFSGQRDLASSKLI